MTAGPPPLPGGRSDDERERARLARAGRRRNPSAQPASARPPANPPPRNRQSRAGTPRAPRSGRRGRVALALGALIALAAVWFLYSLFQPFHGDGSGRVPVVIKAHSSVTDIGSALADSGVVSSGFFFEARATLAGKRGDLKPGSYVLKHDMSYSAAIDALTKGPPNDVVTITLPEGESRAEIARKLPVLKGSYLAATKSSPLLSPAAYGGRHAADLEGFLFPATYEVKRGAGVAALVAKQLTAFRQHFPNASTCAVPRLKLTCYDVVTVASLVEREADPSERPTVASVIYNRLRAHIPLAIDATTRFEFGNWDRAITAAQLRSPSPYNTRIHQGLPPGPIGNPGLASMRAAMNPAGTRFLYYVADCNRPGHHVFATSFAQFQAAAARYDAARQKAGGNAPTHC